MTKIKGFIFVMMVLVLMGISIVVIYQPKNNKNKKVKIDKENNSKEESLIDESLKEQLILEGQNKELNAEILTLVNNGNLYTVQDEIDINGEIYRLIQFNMIKHEHNGKGNGELAAYFRGREDLNQLFLNNLNPENIANDETINEMNKIISIPSEVFDEKYEVPLLKRHVFDKSNDFDFVEKWIVSALVKFDENNQATDAMVYKGAVGLEFVDESEELQIEIFIADKMNCFYYAKEDKINGGIINDCGGLIEGNVYRMNINDKGIVEDISYVRRSVDNEYTQMCNLYVHEFPRYIKLTAKNYDMSMKYFADNILLSQNNENITTYKTHELYGERHSSSPDTGLLYVYFTKDDYVVFINRYGTSAKYIKMTREEFADYEYMDIFDIIHKSQSVIIEGEINPELLKELEN